MWGIIIVAVGIVLLIYGILAFLGRLKMKENDRVSRFYVGIKAVAAGIGAIGLGLILYFTQ